MSDTAAAIGPEEAAALFAGIRGPMALAVSGGADSMALMHLVAMWRGRTGESGTPAPLVLTVDHGLRAESAEEARFVADRAVAYGFTHETLPWRAEKPDSGLQDAARRARYDLLLDRLARDDSRRDLLTAHHQGDQAETLLMRLARGSGLDGLAAMRPVDHRTVVMLEEAVREVVIRLRRPLLDTPKARLVATLRAVGAPWRDDPSNRDVRFERVRLRRAGLELAAIGLTEEALARSARRLGAERAAAEARMQAIAATHVNDHGGAFGSLVLPDPEGWPAADIVRLLARMLAVYGGAAAPAQLSQIETLAQRVRATGRASLGRLTIGGCIVEISDGDDDARSVAVLREPGRQPLPTLDLQPGTSVFWDRRFYIALAAEAPGPVRIGPCDTDSDDELPSGLPRAIIAGLPSLHVGDGRRLLWARALPHIHCRFAGQHVAALRWQHASEAPA